MLKIIFSRNFLISTAFLKVLILSLILILGICILPILYKSGYLEFFNNLKETGFDNDKYADSYHQIVQFVPWLLIVAVSFLVLFLNTVYYVVVAALDLGNTDKKNQKAKRCYFFVVILFLIVALMSGWFVYAANENKNTFKTVIAKPIKQVEPDSKHRPYQNTDAKLKEKIENVFLEFIKNAEIFTIAFFFIFILMDILSLLGKYYSLGTDNHESDLIKLERTALYQQLFLIDISVCVGITLCIVYVNFIGDNLRPEFIYTFSVGAIAMHIIYSQFVFFCLTVLFILSSFELQQSISNQAAPSPPQEDTIPAADDELVGNQTGETATAEQIANLADNELVENQTN